MDQDEPWNGFRPFYDRSENPEFRYCFRAVALRVFAILVLALGLAISTSAGGAPPVLWQRDFVSSGMYSMAKTSDGGCVLVGDLWGELGGNRTSANYGGRDGGVIRLDRAGNKVWDKSFGGTNDDKLFCITQTRDGGFIAGGTTRSGVGGNKISPHFGADTNYDCWVVRMDSQGTPLWDRSWGGSDYLANVESIVETPEGEFLVLSDSASVHSENLGCRVSLIRLNAAGELISERCYYQPGYYLRKILATGDGGMFLAGTCYKNLNADYRLLRLDARGDVLWEKGYGGTQIDGFVGMVPTSDSGLALFGYSYSPPSGNKTSPHYGGEFTSDFWLVRVDGQGNILWDRSYGGTGAEIDGGIDLTLDGGFIIGGTSDSPASGTKISTNWGRNDYWALRLDPRGNVLWEQSFG